MTLLPEALVLRRLYWSAFALRIAVALLAIVLTQMFNLPLMEDASMYSHDAADVAQCWLRGEQSPWMDEMIRGGKSAYIMVGALAIFYCLTGGLEFLPLALTCYCLLTSVTPILAYRAARQLGATRHGSLSAAHLVAYSPAFAFWSAALYKEGLILIVLFLIIEHALRLQETFQATSVLIMAVCLLLLFGLRFYIAAILCICLPLGLAFGRGSRYEGEAAPALLRQGFVLVIVVLVFSLFGLSERVNRLLSVGLQENLGQMNESRRDLATTNSGYLPEADVSEVDSALRFLPIGLAYFLTVPLPWQLGAFRQNLAIPETLFWIVVVYPVALRGIARGARVNPSGTLFLVFSALAICCFYALFIGNIGTAYRVRTQAWAILALLAGMGWSRFPVSMDDRQSQVDSAVVKRGPPSPAELVTH